MSVLLYVISANGLSYSGETQNFRLGNIYYCFLWYNHTGKFMKNPMICYIFVYFQPRWYWTMLPLFFDSTFIQHTHRVVMIVRCNSQHEAGFTGRGRTRNGCVYRRSQDETSPILPSRFLRAPALGIAFRTMRPRLSLLLETRPLKDLLILSLSLSYFSHRGWCAPPVRRFTGYERRWDNCFRFDPFSSRNGRWDLSPHARRYWTP